MTTTTSRLLKLLSLLQTKRDWPGALLAERLGVSHRTVRRDVDRLREMGYSIRATMGPDGGYRLDAGTELPPLLFDDGLQAKPAYYGAVDGELPARQRAANAFRGDVAVAAGATGAVEWQPRSDTA